MAALLEVMTTADEVKFEDIPIENAGRSTSEDVERLRRIIGSRRHLLLGKGNALPLATRGVVCDIDVKPVDQRVRRVAPPPKNLESLQTCLSRSRSGRCSRSLVASTTTVTSSRTSQSTRRSCTSSEKWMKRLTNGTGDGRQIDLTDEDDKWVRAPLAFEMLKNKIVAAAVL
ncbi:hypothetical protein Pcac1_g7559 [Phytophthora cactorum]|uniref:Uncharacterized protein n=1 Tax=Phytophthora cactorum TaxID=29920 RepID=A0A8T1BT76_9STRA|nr:hypothetical protein Pcac1_g7559 [Phytophthora cactorum]KAG2908684.1 hypothetical protein PC117_g19866 [Phytophthora cactorum]KAG3159501.1 hypothetical protein C6341_g14065 [Phytophthora cactorum]